MSDWTSLNEIMRDLSLAQGRKVPGSLAAVSSNTEPPPLNVEEETEEEFYKSCGDVDFTKPPDFNLIQEMLSMVSNKRETLDDDPITNSHLNPLCPEFVPQAKSEKSVVKKKRGEKNVAMKSILESQATKSPVKQPDSFCMFKRKSITPSKEKKHVVEPETCPRINNNCQYTPSLMATQYYNKYMANAKLKEEIQDDIWTRAERQMRLIDERKQRERETSSSSSQDLGEETSVNSSNTSFSSGLDYVNLPQHRHLSMENIEDCVVCNIAAKHGYSFEEDIS